MNTKRIIFWSAFVVILALIVWGMIAAMNKAPSTGPKVGTPPPVTAADHVRGSADAPVTLIEYSDFQCPACETYYVIVERLIAAEGSSTLRFVYRHYPLPQHGNALFAVEASEAAARQGRFWEMHHLLFDNQKLWENAPDAQTIFEGYAKSIGLEAAAFKRDADSDAAKAAAIAAADSAQALNLTSTPTFFVNGKMIVNPPSS